MTILAIAPAVTTDAKSLPLAEFYQENPRFAELATLLVEASDELTKCRDTNTLLIKEGYITKFGIEDGKFISGNESFLSVTVPAYGNTITFHLFEGNIEFQKWTPNKQLLGKAHEPLTAGEKEEKKNFFTTFLKQHLV